MKPEKQDHITSYIISRAYDTYIARGGEPGQWEAYLSTLLGISVDGIRKKLAGVRYFSAKDLNDISAHLNVGLDPGMDITIDPGFSLTPIGKDKNNVFRYFRELVRKLEYINLHQNKKITITCEDIPIFYFFQHAHLSAFKLYFYKHTHFPGQDLLDQSFIDQHPVDEYAPIAHLYNHIPSEELWTSSTINNTIIQVIYLWDSGKLKDEQIAAHIINELQEVIQTIFTNAENESKKPGTKNLAMFCSGIHLGNNQGVFEVGNYKEGFVSTNTFNSVTVTDPDCLADIERWVRNMFATGTQISGEGATERNTLLNIYEAKIELLRKYIIDKDQNALSRLRGSSGH